MRWVAVCLALVLVVAFAQAEFIVTNMTSAAGGLITVDECNGTIKPQVDLTDAGLDFPGSSENKVRLSGATTSQWPELNEDWTTCVRFTHDGTNGNGYMITQRGVSSSNRVLVINPENNATGSKNLQIQYEAPSFAFNPGVGAPGRIILANVEYTMCITGDSASTDIGIHIYDNDNSCALLMDEVGVEASQGRNVNAAVFLGGDDQGFNWMVGKAHHVLWLHDTKFLAADALAYCQDPATKAETYSAGITSPSGYWPFPNTGELRNCYRDLGTTNEAIDGTIDGGVGNAP